MRRYYQGIEDAMALSNSCEWQFCGQCAIIGRFINIHMSITSFVSVPQRLLIRIIISHTTATTDFLVHFELYRVLLLR